MNYQKAYDSLCERAKLELNERLKNKKENLVYYEGHHVIPRCMGGEGNYQNYNHDNIVLLSAREHFLAHLLLCEIYPDNNKLKIAVWAMCKQDPKGFRYMPSSRTYERLRADYIQIMKSTPKTEAHLKALKEAINRPEVKKAKSDKLKNVPKTEEHKKKLKKRWEDPEKREWIMSRIRAVYSDPRVMENRRRACKLGIEAIKNSPDVTCPHCGKVGKKVHLSRWHLDNCKHKTKDDH